MKRICAALAIALAVHAILAVGLAVYLASAPEPKVLARLDLSSVELSFAEQEEATAVAAPSPVLSSQNPLPKPTAPRETPAAASAPKTLPPDPSAPRLLEPKEPPRQFDTPIAQFEQPNNPNNRTSAPTRPAPRQAHVDAPPKLRRNIRPDYPKGSRQRGEQGDVTLEIRVTAEGAVDFVKVAESSGFADLDAAAVKAARAAKFSPAKSGRDSVASTARLKLSFKLK